MADTLRAELAAYAGKLDRLSMHPTGADPRAIVAAAARDMREILASHLERATPAIDRQAVDAALRKVIGHLDYDMHKGLERDEDTGEDTYSEHVDRFIAAYAEAAETER